MMPWLSRTALETMKEKGKGDEIDIGIESIFAMQSIECLRLGEGSHTRGRLGPEPGSSVWANHSCTSPYTDVDVGLRSVKFGQNVLRDLRIQGLLTIHLFTRLLALFILSVSIRQVDAHRRRS